MTREEAIEVVRKNLPHLGIGATEMTDALGTLIPELKESEDERIRKELKEAFEAYDIESKWNGIPIRSIFAWLERQKEPENTSASTMAPSCWAEEPSLQKEPKPAWSEEDIKKIRSEEYTKGFNDAAFGSKLKEWSVEDEDRIRQIERIAQEAGCTQKLQEEIHDWLKSLRPSWKPSEDELTKKHLEGYIKGRNDALREMSDFMELHFNTQSGTSIKSGGNE